MLIENTKDLQKNLIEMIDSTRTRRIELNDGRGFDDHYTDEEIYEIGKLDGIGEAAESLYLAIFGGKAYGELLAMLIAKGDQDAER